MGVTIGPQGLSYWAPIGSQGLYYGDTHRSCRAILWVPHSNGVTRWGLERAQPPLQMFKPSRNFWNCSKVEHEPHTEGLEEVEPPLRLLQFFSGYAVKLSINFKDNRMKHNGNYWRVLTITNSIIWRRKRVEISKELAGLHISNAFFIRFRLFWR
jgi:hypothetical protein